MELRIADYNDYKNAVMAIKKQKKEAVRKCYCCNKRKGIIELKIDQDGVKDLFCGICAGLATEKGI